VTARSARRAAWTSPRPVRIVREPSLTFLDRRSPLVVLAAFALASALAHGLVLGWLGRHPSHAAPAAQPERYQVTLVDPKPAAPPRPELPVPPPPPPPPVVPHRRIASAAPRPARAAEAPTPPSPPSPVPPVPTPSAPTPTEDIPDLAPALVPGLALSATSVAGGMSVARGGNPGGRHGGSSGSGGPGNGKPYKAGEFVDLSGLTEEPIFLDNVSAAEVERFYPPVARAEHFEGAVAVKLIVDDDGSVARVTVVSDPGHGLGAAAAKVARLYRFKPAKVDGRPVATEILFRVHFELN